MPTALSNAITGKVPLAQVKPASTPPYPDTGVGYAGYSKELQVAGYRLRPQTQFWYKLRLQHPWVAGSTAIFLDVKRALFITKICIDWNLNAATGSVEIHISPTTATADSLFFMRTNLSGTQQNLIPYDFQQPMRFDRICYVIRDRASGGVGEEINILVWGYSEEL